MLSTPVPTHPLTRGSATFGHTRMMLHVFLALKCPRKSFTQVSHMNAASVLNNESAAKNIEENNAFIGYMVAASLGESNIVTNTGCASPLPNTLGNQSCDIKTLY
jgi:hypothetical protein